MELDLPIDNTHLYMIIVFLLFIGLYFGIVLPFFEDKNKNNLLPPRNYPQYDPLHYLENNDPQLPHSYYREFMSRYPTI